MLYGPACRTIVRISPGVVAAALVYAGATLADSVRGAARAVALPKLDTASLAAAAKGVIPIFSPSSSLEALARAAGVLKGPSRATPPVDGVPKTKDIPTFEGRAPSREGNRAMDASGAWRVDADSPVGRQPTEPARGYGGANAGPAAYRDGTGDGMEVERGGFVFEVPADPWEAVGERGWSGGEREGEERASGRGGNGEGLRGRVGRREASGGGLRRDGERQSSPGLSRRRGVSERKKRALLDNVE